MGTLITMNISGDSKQMWNPTNPTEIEAARKTFNDLKSKGYIAYHVRDDGKKSDIMREFDPQAGKVILSPPMAGG